MDSGALQFDWEMVSRQPVSAIRARNEQTTSGGALTWDAIAFVMGNRAVVLTVNADNDGIKIAHEVAPADDAWLPVASLSHVVGQTFGWCWLGTNYRGYHDTFILALGDVVPSALEPRLMFLGEASLLSCFDITPHCNRISVDNS